MHHRKAIFAATALLCGLAFLAEPAFAFSASTLATIGRNAPSNLGFVTALDQVREDRDLYRLQLKLDNGSVKTVVQERLNDLRVGDRAEIDAGQAYRHDSRAERIDRWGYWVDAAGYRFGDDGLREEMQAGDGVRN